jgi:hypothetical protein
MKKDEKGKACSMHKAHERYIQKGRDHLEELNGKIIFNKS